MNVAVCVLELLLKLFVVPLPVVWQGFRDSCDFGSLFDCLVFFEIMQECDFQFMFWCGLCVLRFCFIEAEVGWKDAVSDVFWQFEFFTIIGDDFDERFGFFVVLLVVSQNVD